MLGIERLPVRFDRRLQLGFRLGKPLLQLVDRQVLLGFGLLEVLPQICLLRPAFLQLEIREVGEEEQEVGEEEEQEEEEEEEGKSLQLRREKAFGI